MKKLKTLPILILLTIPIFSVICSPNQWTLPKLKAEARFWANRYDVPWYYFFGVIQQESNWNITPLSNSEHSLGIVQLQKRYLKYFSNRYYGSRPIDPFNPTQAMCVAAALLADLFQKTGSWELAIQAYNCGLAPIYAKNIPNSTRLYLQNILIYANYYKGLKHGDMETDKGF